jgi:hypothetical protein
MHPARLAIIGLGVLCSLFAGRAHAEQCDTTYSLAYGHETLFTADEGNVQTDLVDLTVKQALGDQFSLAGEIWNIGLGYTFSRDDGQIANTLGVRLEANIDGTHSLIPQN